MEKEYKKTISGTVGAGIYSLINGSTNYYVLEHKVSSKYHKAGDSQEIIVDYVEMGREKDCAIRFDETFKTVSRRHAAIVKDGNNWKLVQLSKTNSTFLNGQKIINQWYLQSGDEIQLSINGPKLGFIIPNATNKTQLNLAKRFILFKEQALRPYRTLSIIISVVISLIIGCGIGYGMYMNNKNAALEIQQQQDKERYEKEKNEMQKQIIEQQALLIEQTERLVSLSMQLDASNKKLIETEAAAIKAKAQSAKNTKELRSVMRSYEQLQQKFDSFIEEKRMEEEAKFKERENYLNNKKY